jgi:hypothetical protein
MRFLRKGEIGFWRKLTGTSATSWFSASGSLCFMCLTNAFSCHTRLLRPGGTLCVLDISQDYTPSLNMILGEPYVLEYQKSIDNQIKRFRGFLRPRYKDVVPGHVGMWLLQRA